ncbi:MAG: class I tRNA ligase family protein [Candidatus Terrybacteria bacterium]|nr:class I tRNA ligase family protein [Candidatus Terrybacteria bacterium]
MTEQEILKFWQENKIFEKSVKNPPAGGAPNGDFVFYDGPPFATGTPHYGHIVASTIKDAVPRYWTMRGYRVGRKWGWDCHGLPIENIAEKELGIKRKKEIEEMGIAKFNEFCRSKVLEYVEEWKKVIARLGRWADMEDSYKTMDLSFMESVWWVFKQLWEKGLIYEGYRSMHICTRCETTLSQQEVAEGYKDIKDISATVKFELADDPSTSSGQARTFILAWTTTPWTLIGNVALAINPEVIYCKIKSQTSNLKSTEFFILAKERLEIIKDDYEIIEEFKGKNLVDKKYKPLFDYYKGDYKIYPADFVTTDEGTGVVHIAPAFGEDDFKLMEKYKLPFIQHVGMDGIIKPEAKDFAGLSVKPKGNPRETDEKIVDWLKENNKLFDSKLYEHSYPHCWRCETPLINYATSSWFVNIIKIKERAIELAKDINWSPGHIKEGRFGKWLEGARDWSISRQRYWASVIPVWKCEKCKEIKVVGSVDEIRNELDGVNKIFLVRHGEAENNVKNILNSDLNQNHYALTKNGREKMEKMAKELKSEKIDLLFSSPFLRTKETAEIIAKKTGVEIIIDERLREIRLGEFEGKKEEDIWRQFPTRESRAEKADFGVETGEEIRKRLKNFLEEINEKYKSKNIVIVSHGDPIQIFYGLSQGMSLLESLNSWYPEKGSVKIVYSKSVDLHKHVVDEVEFDCKCGGRMKRVPDVLDTWFDSGSMPYAQAHYPFENKEKFEANFPAQFIGEGEDQTRAWFYYLHAIATAIKDSRAFNNVIVNGTVLAEDGKKMAKRLQNYPDPMEVINKYGADALRFYLLSSPVVKAENLNFSEKGVDEAHKKVIMRLKNVLNFYKMYSDKLPVTHYPLRVTNILDKWILVRLNALTGDITKAMDKYELNEAVRPIGDFVEDLSNWYVRRSRERFKEEGQDKNDAITTLRHTLIEFSKIIAPFMPFVAEEIYQEVFSSQSSAIRKESVHLESWPIVGKITSEDEQILETMIKAREITSTALEIRQKEGISIRQVSGSFSTTVSSLPEEYINIVAKEINVKEIKTGAPENKLDTKITPALKNEGMMRELVRNIQDLRKKAGLVPQDKVELIVKTDAVGEKLIKEFENEIKKGTNAKMIECSKNDGKEIKIDELIFRIKI